MDGGEYLSRARICTRGPGCPARVTGPHDVRGPWHGARDGAVLRSAWGAGCGPAHPHWAPCAAPPRAVDRTEASGHACRPAGGGAGCL